MNAHVSVNNYDTFYKSAFYKSSFYRSAFNKSSFYKSFFNKSEFYNITKLRFTSPRFTNPVHSSPVDQIQYPCLQWYGKLEEMLIIFLVLFFFLPNKVNVFSIAKLIKLKYIDNNNFNYS